MNKEQLETILEAIKTYDSIVIFPHARPDGDCIGSSFGLKDLIESSFPGKKVYVSGEGSDFTSFIGTPTLVEQDILTKSLGISLDTANQERIADQRYALCPKLIKIDHHIPVSSFGDIQYVDTGRPAAALIVLDLYMEFKEELKLTEKGANALFFGILTDTGRFKYSGVNADTFRKVAELYEVGLDSKSTYAYLDVRTEELTRFRGYMLQNYKKTENGVVYFEIKPRHLKKFNVTLEEASSLVNDLGSFKDCPIWLLFAEYEGGIVRCRMRSKGPAINELAGKYEGGGHRLACGANLGTWKRTKLLIKDCDELVKKYKEEN